MVIVPEQVEVIKETGKVVIPLWPFIVTTILLNLIYIPAFFQLKKYYNRLRDEAEETKDINRRLREERDTFYVMHHENDNQDAKAILMRLYTAYMKGNRLGEIESLLRLWSKSNTKNKPSSMNSRRGLWRI